MSPFQLPQSMSQEEQRLIKRAIEILDRHFTTNKPAFTSPDAVADYLRLKLTPCTEETFVAMFLDTKHRILAYEELFRGTIDSANVHPRVIVRRALQHNSAAVIVAHNHPSGNPEPSAADGAVTARIKQALSLVDIRLLDHFIVGFESKPVSLAARGLV